MDVNIFLGRFHPLIVHFPIGLIVAAILFGFLSKLRKFKKLSSAVPYLFALGCFTAFLSVILGWLIAEDRGYDEGVLFWHRWVGIAVFILSAFLTLAGFRLISIPEELKNTLYIVVLILVSLTGHLGGSLTHGSDYLLEYAPEIVRENLLSKSELTSSNFHKNPDSLFVFEDIIQPLLLKKCETCHQSSQKKGGLDITTIEGLLKGGDSGPAIEAGKPFSSELFRRITLSPDNRKFMPLKDTPLSYGEVVLISWWIKEGASIDKPPASYPLTQEISEVLVRDFQIDPRPKPIYEVLSPEAPDSQSLQLLDSKGIETKFIAQDNPFLQIKIGVNSLLDEESMEALRIISENITWADLSGTDFSADELVFLADFQHLTELNLSSSSVKDESLRHLTDLRHLKTINLFNTPVTSEGLIFLGELPSLTTLYVWQTEMDDSALEQFMNDHPQVKIENGYRATVP